MNGLIKIKFLLLSLISLCSYSTFTQTSKIDSLEQKFSQAKSNFEKVFVLKDLFFEVQFSDPQKALEIAKEISAMALMSAQSRDELKLESTNLLGIAYMNLNQNDSALFYFQNTLELSKLLKDSIFISRSYNNIGAVNYYQGNDSKAVYYFNKSAEMDEAMGDIEASITSYTNIGSMYLMQGVTDSARYFLTKALDGTIKIDDRGLMAVCYLSLGGVNHSERNYQEAKQNYFKAIKVAESVSDFDLISSAYRNLAILFQDQGKYKIAIEYDLMSLEFALKWGGLSGAEDAYKGLAISYDNLGMYKEAFESQKQYTLFGDSIAELKNNAAFIEMQEKYNSEQTAIENEMLTQKDKINNLENAKNAEELANSRIIIISSILGLVLLIILAFTLYNRNILKQKANQKLQHVNEIINEKNKDIMASIEYASKIQEALLPTKDNQKLFKDSFYLLQPKDIVSGDFFWYAEVEGKKIIAAVDCTGHGVPGAFMSMIGNTFLHEIINEKKIVEPHKVLDELRTRVIRALNQKGDGTNRKDGMDMAICTIDEQAMTLEFAGANNPLYVVQNNEMSELKGDKQPVGYFGEKEVPFNNRLLKLSKGDCIYIFSDGYADQFGGPKGKKFKYKQLRDLLFANYARPMQEQKKLLIDTFEDWKGNLEQVDDVCMVGIRI